MRRHSWVVVAAGVLGSTGCFLLLQTAGTATCIPGQSCVTVDGQDGTCENGVCQAGEKDGGTASGSSSSSGGATSALGSSGTATSGATSTGASSGSSAGTESSSTAGSGASSAGTSGAPSSGSSGTATSSNPATSSSGATASSSAGPAPCSGCTAGQVCWHDLPSASGKCVGLVQRYAEPVRVNWGRTPDPLVAVSLDLWLGAGDATRDFTAYFRFKSGHYYLGGTSIPPAYPYDNIPMQTDIGTDGMASVVGTMGTNFLANYAARVSATTIGATDMAMLGSARPYSEPSFTAGRLTKSELDGSITGLGSVAVLGPVDQELPEMAAITVAGATRSLSVFDDAGLVGSAQVLPDCLGTWQLAAVVADAHKWVLSVCNGPQNPPVVLVDFGANPVARWDGILTGANRVGALVLAPVTDHHLVLGVVLDSQGSGCTAESRSVRLERLEIPFAAEAPLSLYTLHNQPLPCDTALDDAAWRYTQAHPGTHAGFAYVAMVNTDPLLVYRFSVDQVESDHVEPPLVSGGQWPRAAVGRNYRNLATPLVCQTNTVSGDGGLQESIQCWEVK